MVDDDGDRHPRQLEQALEQVADHVRLAACDVEWPARPGRTQQQPVGLDDVAHVAEVPPRREVADLDLRRLVAALDLGNLGAEAGDGEACVLARPEVVERADDRDVERRLERGDLGGRLRDPVGRAREHRFLLADRLALLGDDAVDLGGGHDQDARIGAAS